MDQLVRNSIMTPDGTVLVSYHRHDYVSHLDKNGETYFIDGGNSYQRSSVNHIPFKSLNVFVTDDFTLVRAAFHWGTRGINGNKPLKQVRLMDMTTEHIEAIMLTQTHIDNTYVNQIFEKELTYRNKIYCSDIQN